VKTLVIIPAYNEAKNLPKLISTLLTYPQYDYIIVNDGSKDETMKMCKDNGWHVLDLPVNLGIGGAVQTGYKYALMNGYDIAVQVDGDGQHDPACIEKLIEPLIINQADMVIGSRFIDNAGFQSSLIRRIGINIFKVLIFTLSGKKILDATSGFRAINRKVIQLFNISYAIDFPEPESTMLVLRNKQRIVEVPVIMHERQGGTSSISMKKSIYYMIKVSLAILLSAIQTKIILSGDET